jgi:hypothetical protein
MRQISNVKAQSSNSNFEIKVKAEVEVFALRAG